MICGEETTRNKFLIIKETKLANLNNISNQDASC